MIPRRLTLAAGAALILVANAIALTGVAYNRGGEPESRLVLSERELGRPWSWGGRKENSGLSLSIDWRVLDANVDNYYGYYGSSGGTPGWLDEKRMAELGFDVARAKANEGRREKYNSDAERQVLVVLELGGSDWQQVLARAQERVAHQESLRRASPDAKELVEAEKRAREALVREENENSRLFAVDAGTDLAALRARYPDRSRFMILKGNLRPHINHRDKKSTVTGYLGPLAVGQVNVPHALRSSFAAMPPRSAGPAGKKPSFQATVAVGQRLEPWLEAVSAP